MPRRAEGLNAGKVQKAPPGRYGDGGGLYLLVRSKEATYWIFRYVRFGQMREMGLGAACGQKAVSLTDARRRAKELNDTLRDGIDPLDQRNADAASQKAAKAKAVTFGECANDYIEEHR